MQQLTTPRKRQAFTLLELLLSLALIVLATWLIGYLMQMYSRNFTTRGEDIRRMQLARAVLNMIAEDIRNVVLEQEYDDSVLEQQLGADSGGGQGGGSADEAAASGLASQSQDSLGFGGADSGGLASDGLGTDSTEGTDDLAATATTSLPPGIYGDQYSLMVDVSRLPRPDEYLIQQASLLDGSLADVPGDIKTVTYYLQTATNQGVEDDMNIFGVDTTTGGASSGLVRRALDRGVLGHAEEVGDTDRLSRSGDLVAPEILAVEFSYYDSELGQWVYEWDSSVQSLPWLIQVTLAMQSATGSEMGALEPGTPIANLTFEDRQNYGVEIYELVVAIPGANLTAADAASAEAAAGAEAVGL